MPETCEKWFGLVNSCIYYACQTCGFILNEGPTNIWTGRKPQK